MSEANTDKTQNPASDPKVELQRRRRPRIPMSSARRKLEVADMPGWHLHWFKEDNVAAALDAYYEFVKRGEVALNQNNVSGSVTDDGNTDMGTNVSMVAGKNDDGSPVRLILMKLREDWFKEDQKDLERRNGQIMQAIFGDEAAVGEGGEIRQRDPNTYVGKASLGLFNRPIRKAKVGRRAT